MFLIINNLMNLSFLLGEKYVVDEKLCTSMLLSLWIKLR